MVVGYQKTVSGYVEQAVALSRSRPHELMSLVFEHHNPHRPEDLAQVFLANREGMLLNQCSHELALWINRWGLRSADIIDVLVHDDGTRLLTLEGVTDFSEIAFTVITNLGRNFTLRASRCGGTDSRVSVRFGKDGERVFSLAGDAERAAAERELAADPTLAWYQPLFRADYLRLKHRFVEHIRSGAGGEPPGAPTLADAVGVIEMAESLLPVVLAQARRGGVAEEGCSEPPPAHPHERHVMFTISDPDGRTPTVQRIWHAPDLFAPDCSLLVDVLRPPRGRIVVCVDDRVWELHGARARAWAEAQGVRLDVIQVPGGERAKTVQTWLKILEDLYAANPLRHSEPVVALGGGAVTDTVGFAAAAWRRSTPWVRIPTTLLGMVDASVGIKVSVNHLRKNGVGAFHIPRHTFIDPLFLRTNDERTLKAAVGEIMKAGIIYDPRILEDLRAHGPELIRARFLGSDGMHGEVADRIIRRSIEAMIRCIGSDLHEENLAREMDFGHTFSRCLENHERFRLMHGEAVAVDCVFSVLIAEQKGLLTRLEADGILDTFKAMGLSVHVHGLTLPVYKEALEQITVHRSGALRAPLPGPVGRCSWVASISDAEMEGAWRRLQAYVADYPEGVVDPDRPAAWSADDLYRAADGLVARPLDELPHTNQRLRWGILGCGNIANDFVRVLKVVPGNVVQAVAARDGDRARDFAEKHGVATWYAGYQRLVEDPDVDIVYVATVPECHREHAELALRAGKHVLVEKPLADTPEDAAAIRDAARASGKFCMEGMWMRFFPAVELARRTAMQGLVGEVRHVRSDFGFDLVEDEGAASNKWGTGAGMNAGVYPAHAAVMVLGTEVVSQSAVGSIDSFGGGMDAEGALYARFSRERTALVTWSHVSETAEEVDVVGTRGNIRLHSPAHAPTTVSITRKEGDRRGGDRKASTHYFPLPRVPGELFYPNSEGLCYEVVAVQRCVAAGLTECPQAPLSESVRVIEMVHRAVADIVEA